MLRAVSETSYPLPFGSYVLLEHLGRGGMADVELARRAVDDARFVRFVVIKRIQARHLDDKSFVRMFTDEARISAELQQEHIAQVYDFGQVGEEYFLAMEYVPGVNLRHVQRALASRGQVPPFRVTLRVLADVLSALQYAHARVDTYGRPMRLVHRDVNPRNVMLSVRGEVKLIDFGVAKADTRSEQTVGKSMKGKFAYMAPEQIEPGTEIDGRTDLFAMGLVMHELVAGRSPYAGMNEAQIIRETMSGPVPALKVPALFPDSAALRAIHDKALAKRPADRYADAAAMREDIVRVAACVGGLASREEMAEFLRKVAPEDVAQITERLKTYRDSGPMSLTPPASAPGPATTPAPPTLADLDRSEAHTIVPEESLPSLKPKPKTSPGTILGLVLLALLGVFAVVVVMTLPSPPAPELAAASSAGVEAAPPPSEPGAPPPPGEAAPSEPQTVGPTPPDPATTGGAGGSPRVIHSGGTARTATTAAPEASAAETPAAVQQGFLNVSSAPARGYEVYLDGQKIGVTPLKSFRAPVGTHSVEIRDVPGGRTWRRQVEVAVGQPAVVSTETNP